MKNIFGFERFSQQTLFWSFKSFTLFWKKPWWQRSYRPTSGQLCLFGSLDACAHPFRRCPFVAGWLMLRWAFLGPLDIELLLMIGVMVEWPVSRSLKKEAAEEAAVERTLVFNRVGCKSWLESLGTQFTFSS